MDDIEIRTSRTILRAFRKTDAADVFDDVTPVFARFLSRKMTHLPASFAELSQSWLSSIDDGADLYFVIRLTTDESHLGIVYLRGIRTPYAELSIWFREEVYGQGFEKEILSAVAAWATQALEVPFLEFCVEERDVESRIIAEFSRDTSLDAVPVKDAPLSFTACP